MFVGIGHSTNGLSLKYAGDIYGIEEHLWKHIVPKESPVQLDGSPVGIVIASVVSALILAIAFVIWKFYCCKKHDDPEREEFDVGVD